MAHVNVKYRDNRIWKILYLDINISDNTILLFLKPTYDEYDKKRKRESKNIYITYIKCFFEYQKKY